MKIILCDIEGTTTDICFVKEVLFPYAKENCSQFLHEHFEDPEIKEIVRDLYELSIKDGTPIQKSDDQEICIKSIVENVHRQISLDRKSRELKSLQGKIWKVAFENGSIKGHVYDDVPSNIEKWANNGAKIFIYSSGSVEAQKLLFGYSVFGNLLKNISGHFDTNIGQKQDVQSYRNIAQELEVEPEEILFLSDIVQELVAAEEAGMKTIIVDRPNNPTNLTDDVRKRFKPVKTFDEIKF